MPPYRLNQSSVAGAGTAGKMPILTPMSSMTWREGKKLRARESGLEAGSVHLLNSMKGGTKVEGGGSARDDMRRRARGGLGHRRPSPPLAPPPSGVKDASFSLTAQVLGALCWLGLSLPPHPPTPLPYMPPPSLLNFFKFEICSPGRLFPTRNLFPPLLASCVQSLRSTFSRKMQRCLPGGCNLTHIRFILYTLYGLEVEK